MNDKDLLTLPADLPAPADDGAADHLPGAPLPEVALVATDGPDVRLDCLSGRTVVFVYPRTGTPGEPSLGGDEAWNAIPGARGCTPEVCSIRDLHDEFRALGARVYGLSTQTTEEQAEAAERLHLPYPLLSDAGLELAGAMRLPTFEVEGVTLLGRITLFLEDGRVSEVQYPVFPPDGAAEAALAALAT
jgi:peroxiredoxin